MARRPRGCAAGHVSATSVRRRHDTGFRGTGGRVPAVDPEQHEPGGVRGVSSAVPQRGVPGARAGPVGRAAEVGAGWGPGRTAHRWRRVADFRSAGPRSACLGLWDGGGHRCLDDYRRTDTGRLLDGKLTGHWVARGSDGTVAEGPTVDGEWNGHWVRRNPNGTVAEGPAVGGTWHGRWIIRDASGDFLREEWWEDGRRTR